MMDRGLEAQDEVALHVVARVGLKRLSSWHHHPDAWPWRPGWKFASWSLSSMRPWCPLFRGKVWDGSCPCTRLDLKGGRTC